MGQGLGGAMHAPWIGRIGAARQADPQDPARRSESQRPLAGRFEVLAEGPGGGPRSVWPPAAGWTGVPAATKPDWTTTRLSTAPRGASETWGAKPKAGCCDARAGRSAGSCQAPITASQRRRGPGCGMRHPPPATQATAVSPAWVDSGCGPGTGDQPVRARAALAILRERPLLALRRGIHADPVRGRQRHPYGRTRHDQGATDAARGVDRGIVRSRP